MKKKELERLNARYRDTIELLTKERDDLLEACLNAGVLPAGTWHASRTMQVPSVTSESGEWANRVQEGEG